MPSDGIGYASVLLHVSSMITDLPSCVAAICCFGFSCSSSDLLIPAYTVFRNLMLPLSFSCIFDTILLLVFFIKAVVDQSFRYFTTQSINSFKSSKVAVGQNCPVSVFTILGSHQTAMDILTVQLNTH